jgi:hypothetical protein
MIDHFLSLTGHQTRYVNRLKDEPEHHRKDGLNQVRLKVKCIYRPAADILKGILFERKWFFFLKGMNGQAISG